MKIKYKGHSCFVVYGKEFSLCLDPYDNIGLTPIDVKADYYFCSHSHYDHNNWSITGGKPFACGKTIKSYHDKQRGALRGNNDILLAQIDGVTFAHLGDLGEAENEQLVNQLKGVDVLMIPVGGNYTIDYLEAKWYVDKIKPKIVIPMHYHIKGSTVDIDTVDKFLKVNDYKHIEQNQLDLQTESLPQQTQVVQLVAEVI